MLDPQTVIVGSVSEMNRHCTRPPSTLTEYLGKRPKVRESWAPCVSELKVGTREPFGPAVISVARLDLECRLNRYVLPGREFSHVCAWICRRMNKHDCAAP